MEIKTTDEIIDNYTGLHWDDIRYKKKWVSVEDIIELIKEISHEEECCTSDFVSINWEGRLLSKLKVSNNGN